MNSRVQATPTAQGVWTVPPFAPGSAIIGFEFSYSLSAPATVDIVDGTGQDKSCPLPVGTGTASFGPGSFTGQHTLTFTASPDAANITGVFVDLAPPPPQPPSDVATVDVQTRAAHDAINAARAACYLPPL